MKKWSFVLLLVIGATLLGATVLREPIASAAQILEVRVVSPLDAGGNVKVHEQGTADVNVTNASVPVHEQGTVDVAVSPDANAVRAEPHLTDRYATNVALILNPGQFERGFDLTVPAGKLLVVEHISARVRQPETGPAPSVTLGYRTGPNIGAGLYFDLQHQQTTPGGEASYGYDSDVALVIWPSSVAPHLEYEGSGIGVANVSVTGYLVDTP